MSIPYHYKMPDSGSNQKKEVKGILSFIDNELLFEYKVYDQAGQSISNLAKFSIQLSQISQILYKKGFLWSGGKLVIEAKHQPFFEPLPGSRQGIIKLNINRADKAETIRFSTKMNLYMSRNLADSTKEKD